MQCSLKIGFKRALAYLSALVASCKWQQSSFIPQKCKRFFCACYKRLGRTFGTLFSECFGTRRTKKPLLFVVLFISSQKSKATSEAIQIARKAVKVKNKIKL